MELTIPEVVLKWYGALVKFSSIKCEYYIPKTPHDEYEEYVENIISINRLEIINKLNGTAFVIDDDVMKHPFYLHLVDEMMSNVDDSELDEAARKVYKSQ